MTLVLIASILLVPLTAALCHAYAESMCRRAIGQQIRKTGPEHHAAKAGTPTMGGVIILGLWILAVIGLIPVSPLTPMAALILASGAIFGAIGALDDGISLHRRESTGLTGIAKILLSTVASILLFVAFREPLLAPILVPFTTITLSLPPVAAFFVTWLVFLSATNGANLADGLDGLATGLIVIILIGFAVIHPELRQLALVLPLAGILLGFLWINTHPAGLFLGDAGSFGLGGILAALALSQGLTFVLPILAGVLVLEAMSVILQVAGYRLFGVRLFRMSPLHHHFEARSRTGSTHRLPSADWAEQKIAVRFWIAQAVFVAVAVLATNGIGSPG